MLIASRGTFKAEDVTLLLTDMTGSIEPKPTAERERLIQGGVHYSETLPFEYSPSKTYLDEYYNALNTFSLDVANAVVEVSKRIYETKGANVVLVSLARAGTPAGILIKRFLKSFYGVVVPHYTISIIRDRGIDDAAMKYICERHSPDTLQFVDGWTGKGAILGELIKAVAPYVSVSNERKLLAVIADPANVTDICGTHEDLPIASSFLNSTVCGLMSRTIFRKGIDEGKFHGVVFYENLASEDRTYEFIDKIGSCFAYCHKTGIDEIKTIAEKYSIRDINLIKPGIGETTRVLLRRLPYMVLLAEDAEDKYVAHIVQLAKEKNVTVEKYPLRRYKACGIIKEMSSDV
jgi:hypothetical protein